MSNQNDALRKTVASSGAVLFARRKTVAPAAPLTHDEQRRLAKLIKP